MCAPKNKVPRDISEARKGIHIFETAIELLLHWTVEAIGICKRKEKHLIHSETNDSRRFSWTKKTHKGCRQSR